MSIFNIEQQEYMKELAAIPPKERCWCGWSRFGQCFNCDQYEILKNLTLADKLPLQCPECRNAPAVPGGKIVHIYKCSRSETKNL